MIVDEGLESESAIAPRLGGVGDEGGAVIDRLDSLNAAYYGSQTVSARSILKEGKYVNPGSEPLVAALAVR